MNKIKKNNNVLVIGGSGFLGSHVADELSLQGYKVTIFDILNSKWLKKSQKMIVGNVSSIDLLSKLIKKNDYIFYFSGISDIEESK